MGRSTRAAGRAAGRQQRASIAAGSWAPGPASACDAAQAGALRTRAASLPHCLTASLPHCAGAHDWESAIPSAALEQPGAELLLDERVQHTMAWPDPHFFWQARRLLAACVMPASAAACQAQCVPGTKRTLKSSRASAAGRLAHRHRQPGWSIAAWLAVPRASSRLVAAWLPQVMTEGGPWHARKLQSGERFMAAIKERWLASYPQERLGQQLSHSPSARLVLLRRRRQGGKRRSWLSARHRRRR